MEIRSSKVFVFFVYTLEKSRTVQYNIIITTGMYKICFRFEFLSSSNRTFGTRVEMRRFTIHCCRVSSA